MIQRIDLAYELERKGTNKTNPRELLRDLHAKLVTRTNPLFQKLLTLEQVAEYAAKHQLRLTTQNAAFLSIDGARTFVG